MDRLGGGQCHSLVEDEPSVGQAVYDELCGLDPESGEVDGIIRRLLIEHTSGWARLGRVEGEGDGAWIITITGSAFDDALYWEYRSGEAIVLLALVVRDR